MSTNGMAGDQSTHRADIDGLRGLAIVAVVLFHLDLWAGGFIGVDVFFVVSGFVITRGLLAELRHSGRLDVIGFWSRRIRRLVPAATAMTATVAVASLVVGSAVEWRRIGTDLVAAALFGANVRFGVVAGDYFAADVTHSPVLHMWSLGVEEQFYLAWPLMLLVGLGVPRRFAERSPQSEPRRVVVATTVLAMAASLALWAWWSSTASPWAFYAMPARAWELAAGALVAGLAPDGLAPGRRRQLVWGAGAALLGVSLVAAVDRQTMMVLATAGTAVVIAASTTSRTLTNAWLGGLGRRSYGWYLWHWPLLAMLTLTTSQTTMAGRLAMTAVSLVVAAVSFRFLEEPLRHGPLLRSRRRTWTFLLVVVVATGAVSLTMVLLRKRAFRDSPLLARLAVAQRDFHRMPGCFTVEEALTSPACARGLSAQRHVLVVGDSHAWMWVPAIVEAASAQGLGVRFLGIPSCPAPSLDDRSGGRLPDVCTRLQRSVLARAPTAQPSATAAVVMASYGLFRPAMWAPAQRAEEAEAVWQRGFERTLRAFDDVTRIVILDGPRLPHDPLYCLARPFTDCDVDAAVATAPLRWAREAETRAAAAVPGTIVIDPMPVLCPDGVCRAHQKETDTYPFADNNHVSRSGAMALVPLMKDALATGTATLP